MPFSHVDQRPAPGDGGHSAEAEKRDHVRVNAISAVAYLGHQFGLSTLEI
jgi:hypothetical protein